MRATYRPGTRAWLLLPAAVLVLSGLAAGCSSSGSTSSSSSSSSKPAYCTTAGQLKTSVHNLADVKVATDGLSSLQTALGKVQASANTFAADAKSAYPAQTTALKNSLSSLDAAIKSAKGQPPLTAAAAVVPAVTQVKTSASNLQSAVKGKCQ
jgi:hypothetical protein